MTRKANYDIIKKTAERSLLLNKKELFKRYILFIAGLFFSGIGVAFARHCNLGVSPPSSVANIMSMKYPFLSLGNWLIIWNCLMILGQILVLRRDFKLYQLLQIPLSFLFGFFTDFGMWCASFIPADNYYVKLIILFIGIVALAFGIALTVIADVIMNSASAFVKAMADKSKFEFGYIKVGFDVVCVVTAVILSVLFFDGEIIGTREGTVISAIVTGFIIKFITKHIRKYADKFITTESVL